ncbi:uncharacterized protein AMSG_00529 [Thecamonas trahens ATCC 50062]|uniref:Uncharacterized protein n=1 Tax=Thecamonas trahens ATCC 50062 TaxID=461836 RepID=A0A0L0D8P3_THETB|nr:hypothetical protein AMSG_00529 [Thecamonas trahens ATCC 50062]KNC48752.1 hypothetical protein AMSG_00529 [Thecamonas trahens ATCC 50062]|eukprot:XP_013762803.1 hypothetical protein AMSG_00529 [Thecamonas trahens ATCC 50062]
MEAGVCPVCERNDIMGLYCGRCVGEARAEASARVAASEAVAKRLRSAVEPLVAAASGRARWEARVDKARDRVARLKLAVAAKRQASRRQVKANKEASKALAKRRKALAKRRARLATAMEKWDGLVERWDDEHGSELPEVQASLIESRRALVVELLSVLPLNPIDEHAHELAGLAMADDSTSRPAVHDRLHGRASSQAPPHLLVESLTDEEFDAIMATLVRLLSLVESYLGVALPYPIVHHGSRSLIGYTPVGPWITLFRNAATFGDDDETEATLAGLPVALRSAAGLIYDWEEGLALLNYNIAVVAAASAGLPTKVRELDSPLRNLLQALRSPYVGAQSMAYTMFGSEAEEVYALPWLGYHSMTTNQFERLQRALQAHLAAAARAGGRGRSGDGSGGDDEWELV